MARRKKNAGKGYGMMFHGNFASKADAKKKERQVHGFIKPTTIKGKRRFMVMSERKNPIRRKRNARARSAPSISREMKKLTEKLNRELASGRIDASEHHRRMGILRDYEYEQRHPYIRGSENPSELLVMGANPSQWGAGHETMHNPASAWGAGHEMTHSNPEIVLKPGQTYTIRSNPTSVENPTRTERELLAMARKAMNSDRPTSMNAKLVMRSLVMNQPSALSNLGGYAQGHEAEARWIYDNVMHDSEVRAEAHRRGYNPSAEAIRESFVGAPSEGYTLHNVEGIPSGDYAQLGELLSLYVKPVIGGQVREIRFKDRPLLLTDTSARQLYFIDGDQEISAENLALFNDATTAGLCELGEVRRIDYKQRKEHVPDPDVDEWKHAFGEENGSKPTLWYNERTKQLILKGGDYVVRAEGITN